MEKILSVEEFRKLLNSVYDDYFLILTSEKMLKKYFVGFDINQVKLKQMNRIVHCYSLYREDQKEELKKELEDLGRLHQNIGVNFPVFIEFTRILENFIAKFILNNLLENSQQILYLNDFFNFCKNYIAVGYLKETVKKEKRFLREYVEINLPDEHLWIKNIVDNHIAWKEEILDYISDKINTLNIELDPNKCELGKWLRKVNTKDKSRLEKLIDLHRLIHFLAENLIELKEEKKYVILFYSYEEFIKINLIFLTTLIAFIMEQEIEELQKDPLTGLLTRRGLKNIYYHVMEISIITQISFGLAFLDIDNFKSVNDTYGHKAGDLVLKKISKVLKKSLRKSDYIFRYGGEEFVIIIPVITSKKEFQKILENIRKKIEKTKIKINSKEINVTVSIGGVLIKPVHKVPVAKAINEADMLMYQAKSKGKNQVIVDELP